MVSFVLPEVKIVSPGLLNRSKPILVLGTPLVPAEIWSQSCVCPPNWTSVVVTEFPLLSVTAGQLLPAPGVAITGPRGPVPKQMKPVVVASPSSWNTPLESSAPPPGLLNCASALGGSAKAMATATYRKHCGLHIR